MAAVAAKPAVLTAIPSKGNAEVGLAVAVVFVIGLLIVPLPGVMLDMLLVTSISLSLVVLLSALYTTNRRAEIAFDERGGDGISAYVVAERSEYGTLVELSTLAQELCCGWCESDTLAFECLQCVCAAFKCSVGFLCT